MISLTVAFLPGVNLLNGKKLMDAISWDVIMMIGGIQALAGVDPETLCLIVGVFAGIELVFPLDSIPLITYGEGYYTMTDMAKYGIVPTAVLCLMCATILPFIAGLIGF